VKTSYEGDTAIWRSVWQNGLFGKQGLEFKSWEKLLTPRFQATKKITLNQKILSYSVKK
jgi:hypothetical protein